MPASKTTKLITDQTTIEPDGRLSISASEGQLLVYVISPPGRSVAQAHEVQKKKSLSCCIRSGSRIVFAGMA